MSSPLDQLPLFATDLEIAQAIVGKTAAAKWVKERLPTLATLPGFPKVDEFHGGRPVPLVRLFYEEYLGLPRDGAGGLPQGKENPEAWGRKSRGTKSRVGG